MIWIDAETPLADMFAVCDMVMADVAHSAACDAFLLTDLPILTLATEQTVPPTGIEAHIHVYSHH
jgi:hypothetical protein